jgi:5-(carboxyamino)imidazole ribonucleotide synthase
VRVGIVGGGQLGRMLALAGIPLNLSFEVLDPDERAPARTVAHHIACAYDDPGGLRRLAAASDVVTYEFENVPVQAAHALAHEVPVLPPPRALEAAQDRLLEKSLFERVGIPVHRYAAVATADELSRALDSVGLPAVVKSRRFGYDGKGQIVVRRVDDPAEIWQRAGGHPSIVESLVDFDRELSVLAVRTREGEAGFYPLVENHHRDGILRLSLAPAPALTVELQAAAEAYAARVMEALDYVGVLAIELFQVGDALLANEMAPRVHNSGHWTIEGAETSQFEQHLRAVTGLPLGSTELRGHSAMVNLLGAVPDPTAMLSVAGTHLHVYGKDARPGRKLGHVTVRADDEARLREGLSLVERLVDGPSPD